MANDFAPLSSLTRFLPTKAHDVWAWNLDVELQLFFAAVAAAGSEGVIALDCEFPGLLRQVPENATDDEQYEALRVNVELVPPLQMGFAVADHSGQVLGLWRFNLYFNAGTDHHLEGALSFLTATGLECRRHATEGIDTVKLGRRLAAGLFAMRMQGAQCSTGPTWVTFSGELSFGYLLKIFTTGQPVPTSIESFKVALSRFCPKRVSLKKLLAPYGSLESWIAFRHSDALSTLRLFVRLHFQKGSSGAGCEAMKDTLHILQAPTLTRVVRGTAPAELWGPAALLAAGSSATWRPGSAATALWGPAALISALERA